MVDIPTALTIASHSIKLLQDLRGIDKSFDAAEFKLKIADLNTALADLKLALTDAREELSSKDVEIGKLKAQFRRFSETVEVKGFKYDKKDDGTPRGFAYCQVCEQKEGLLIHLTRIESIDMCPNCKAKYQDVMIYGD